MIEMCDKTDINRANIDELNDVICNSQSTDPILVYLV